MFKWPKTRNFLHRWSVVRIPSLGSTPFCIAQVFKIMTHDIQASSNDKLCPYLLPPSYSIISEVIGFYFENSLPLAHCSHCCHISSVTFAFNNTILLQFIKTHNAWSSDAVCLYMTFCLQQTSSVATMFKHLLFKS